MLNIIGQCGPLLGTRVYPDTDSPRFVEGHSICAAFMGFTTCLAVLLRFIVVWQNRSLDRQYGTLEEQTKQAERDGLDVTQQSLENYGQAYRYVV